MSFEGYYQFLCASGHQWTVDVHELDWIDEKDYPRCPICHKNYVWENLVNLTNGSFDEKNRRIDGYKKLKVKKKISGVCSCCGKEHICEVTYHIPK